jgi:AraC family transcriptional regulator
LSRLTAATDSGSKSALVLQLEASLDAKPEGELIARLAAHNGMSTRTYMRRIRLETGLSATQYLSQLRAERAKTLLRTTSLSVLEIALRLGYCDRSHFARAFSRAVGMTPSQYRASIV